MTFHKNTPWFVMSAACLVLGASAVFAAACGSETTGATPGDEDGGSRTDGSVVLPTGDRDPDDGNHDPLNGVDAGCPIKTAGPHAGKVTASIPRAGAGGLVWATPDNAKITDSQFARVTLDLGQTTEHLRITSFGFEIPPSATIKGVEVTLKRQASDNGIGDGNIELWLDGTPSDRPKWIRTTPWPRAIVGVHHYGQAVDTWGNDLTPELVGRPGFGVELYALRWEDAGAGPLEARVDSMRMSIFYCE